MRTALVLSLILAVAVVDIAAAQRLQAIKLPEVKLENDISLMQALKERKSTREYADRELSLQDLSNLLWCANGINRPDSGRRTSPSAMNKQDIAVYAILKEGIYLYDAAKHELVPVIAGDYRKDAGMQPYVATAPLNLVLVSDISNFEMVRGHEEQLMTGAIDAGHCSQNVYLYGAAANLAVVTRTSIDKANMAKLLGLGETQVVILSQTIGYPKE